MNAHQRRKESRRLHMQYPLGKQVRLGALLGRSVYAYGRVSAMVTINAVTLVRIDCAKVNRHVRCGHGGLIDLVLVSHSGDEQVISTSARGLRLVNPSDRAPRPWWVETRRKHKAQAAIRKATGSAA